MVSKRNLGLQGLVSVSLSAPRPNVWGSVSRPALRSLGVNQVPDLDDILR